MNGDNVCVSRKISLVHAGRFFKIKQTNFKHLASPEAGNRQHNNIITEPHPPLFSQLQVPSGTFLEGCDNPLRIPDVGIVKFLYCTMFVNVSRMEKCLYPSRRLCPTSRTLQPTLAQKIPFTTKKFAGGKDPSAVDNSGQIVLSAVVSRKQHFRESNVR